MYLSPQRRRRILRAHNLRQHGSSLRDIAQRLQVSAATVHADLRALETDWTDIAQATRNDLLLQQINRLNRRIQRLIQQTPTGLLAEVGFSPDPPVTIDAITRLHALREQSLNAACRELRLLLQQVPADHQPPGDVIELEQLPFPDDQLADPDPANHVQSDRTALNKPEHLPPTIPSRTREISAVTAPEIKSSEQPNTTLPRHTGRNQPCSCGSGRKRKRCCSSSPLPLSRGEMSRSNGGGVLRQRPDTHREVEAPPRVGQGLSVNQLGKL